MKYNIKDVRTGMILRKSIISVAGNVIVQRDTVLTYDLIQKLKGMGITVLDIVDVLRPEKDEAVEQIESDKVVLEAVEQIEANQVVEEKSKQDEATANNDLNQTDSKADESGLQNLSFAETEKVNQILANISTPQDQVEMAKRIASENLQSITGNDEDVARVRAMRETEQYKQFLGHYEDSLKSFEKDMSDFLNRQDDVKPDSLIKKTTDVLNANKSATIDFLRMMYCMENMDKSTYAHSLNVSMIARILGEWMGMRADELDILTLGGLLHDIGKLDIDPEILFKPDKLTKEEFEIVKSHPMNGYTAVQNNKNIHEDVKMCILQHHERFDGSGYPLGYRGDQINRYARIITIADVYDALTARRCYKAGMSPFRAAAIIQSEAFEKYSVSVALTFLTKIANSYLGETVYITGNREVKIIQINEQDLIHPLVVDLGSGNVVDLHKTGDEIIKIL